MIIYITQETHNTLIRWNIGKNTRAEYSKSDWFQLFVKMKITVNPNKIDINQFTIKQKQN